MRCGVCALSQPPPRVAARSRRSCACDLLRSEVGTGRTPCENPLMTEDEFRQRFDQHLAISAGHLARSGELLERGNVLQEQSNELMSENRIALSELQVAMQTVGSELREMSERGERVAREIVAALQDLRAETVAALQDLRAETVAGLRDLRAE